MTTDMARYSDRDPYDIIIIEREILLERTNLIKVLEDLPTATFILNDKRQVLFANKAALDHLGCPIEDLIGHRTGEAFDCIHSAETTGGCGTTPACAVCGAMSSILGALTGDGPMRCECRLTIKEEQNKISQDLLIHSNISDVDERKFVLVNMRDISDEKRREVLERVFLHDIMNSVLVISSGINLLENGENGEDFLSHISVATKALQDEIAWHRSIFEAERLELVVHPSHFSVDKLLKTTISEYLTLDICKGKQINLEG